MEIPVVPKHHEHQSFYKCVVRIGLQTEWEKGLAVRKITSAPLLYQYACP